MRINYNFSYHSIVICKLIANKYCRTEVSDFAPAAKIRKAYDNVAESFYEKLKPIFGDTIRHFKGLFITKFYYSFVKLNVSNEFALRFGRRTI